MATSDFILDLFCRVDDRLHGLPKHPQARLWPSEIVTLAMLHALKGCGNRAFYRWVERAYRDLFPRLPERTRLFRLFNKQGYLNYAFLAELTVWGVADTYGIELLHPLREGRSLGQLGRKGRSNHCWLVGLKLGLLLNQWGLIAGWVQAPANIHAVHWQVLVKAVEDRMVVLADDAFHAAEGDPLNLKVGPRGEWNDRMVIETVLAMRTTVSDSKTLHHRAAEALQTCLAFTVAVFKLLVQGHGLQRDENGFIPLSMTEFSL